MTEPSKMFDARIRLTWRDLRTLLNSKAIKKAIRSYIDEYLSEKLGKELQKQIKNEVGDDIKYKLRVELFKKEYIDALTEIISKRIEANR